MNVSREHVSGLTHLPLLVYTYWINPKVALCASFVDHYSTVIGFRSFALGLSWDRIEKGRRLRAYGARTYGDCLRLLRIFLKNSLWKNKGRHVYTYIERHAYIEREYIYREKKKFSKKAKTVETARLNHYM